MGRGGGLEGPGWGALPSAHAQTWIDLHLFTRYLRMREGLSRWSCECEIHPSPRCKPCVLYDVCVLSLYVFGVCCSHVSMLACWSGCACLGAFLV